MECLDYLLIYLVCVGGDNSKLICILQSAYQLISYKAGNKAIQHTHTHRLVVVDYLTCQRINVRVDKIRRKGYHCIYCKSDIEEIKERIFAVYVLCDYIRAACRAVLSRTYCVNQSAKHTADNDGKYHVVSICVVNKSVKRV